ncbi:MULTISPECIES: YqiA/YcfP family alpha/beta fold hydrolase [Cyanophyceae]|uniref:YqiA/YcfP family alpha/beta fold hydrolase n=1 Tax=Cyanophyceae TaxID=3028117 RepID=UPI001689A63E|nr:MULTISPECIES: YqiA/YcfP family alpha/beta fold hydrolase [Cyanophyceae]MBD1919027.1 alpha/beta fold hydrolase [Phormidium sp. FACHB-77]MBD2031989.1 alpha/beta fold hydrolase [Phormidium sp. FACHB-322]MBD2053952.1 alpha/beta fold hydrolase [Leptolyngbya sp. FACHB-60]
MPQYLYLHGFASSPQSAKAQAMKARFAALGLDLIIPDLNQDDFAHLTLSRQIQQVSLLVLAQSEPTILIGSSLGGLTAAWVVQQAAITNRIEKLVLLAPAFDFLKQWLPRIGPDQLEAWRTEGTLPIYHYTEQRTLPLHYNFIIDAQSYSDDGLKAQIPTLILHGTNDETISIEASRAYAATRPSVRLVELFSDHALTDVEKDIWQHTQEFLRL